MNAGPVGNKRIAPGTFSPGGGSHRSMPGGEAKDEVNAETCGVSTVAGMTVRPPLLRLAAAGCVDARALFGFSGFDW